MGAPVSFRPMAQRGGNDCAVAALAMLLGVDYLAVLHACEKRHYHVHKQGLTSNGIVKIAAGFKLPLGNRRVLNLPEDGVGILTVRRGNTYHAVLFFHGLICDPCDGVVWEGDTFLKVSRYKPYRWLEA